MIFIICLCIAGLIVSSFEERRKERLNLIRSAFAISIIERQNKQKKKESMLGGKYNISDKVVYIVAIIVCVLLSSHFLGTWWLGIVAGFILPRTLKSVWDERQIDAYQNNVKKALRFGSAYFASQNAVVEDWIHEMAYSLEGKLRETFVEASTYIHNNVSTRDVVADMQKKVPHAHMKRALHSIDLALQESGDLKTIMDETLDDLMRDEQFVRGVRNMRKANRKGLMIIAGVPLGMYFMFKGFVDKALASNPILALESAVGIALIIIIFNKYSSSLTVTTDDLSSDEDGDGE